MHEGQRVGPLMCHQVHGFNVSDQGEATTDRADPYIKARGFIVKDHDYGHLGLAGVRMETDAIAEHITRQVIPGDVYFGHSHGGTVFARCVEMGARFSKAVLVHPALNRHWEPPADCHTEIHVFHHWTDYATWGARLLRLFSPGNLIWGKHYWGAMGSLGPSSPRLIGHKGSKWHSSGFKNIEYWGPKWAECLGVAYAQE